MNTIQYDTIIENALNPVEIFNVYMSSLPQLSTNEKSTLENVILYEFLFNPKFLVFLNQELKKNPIINNLQAV